ncbi:MAG: hypothetical protein KAU36_05330, partial [candidate division Zixibacteria bacterium]|nr:hypothetical protein [candidate division Zixibacteria bacterium]
MLMRIVVLSAALLMAALVAGCSDSETGDTVAPGSSLSMTDAGPAAGFHRGMLFEELGLSEEQQAAVKEVLMAHRVEMKEMRESLRESGSMEEMAQARETMKVAMIQELKPILTEGQLAKFEQLTADREAHIKERLENGEVPRGFPGHKFGGPISVFAEQLELTDEQQSQIKKLFEAARDNFKPGEQFPPDLTTRTEMRDQMKEKLE